MSNIWTIARRDFRSYFTTPIAYIVIALFMGIMGWMFFYSVVAFNTMSMNYQRFNMGKGPSISEAIIRPLYGNMNVIFLFLVPFITMRLFAEEKKQHTIELLMTSPLRLSEIILGKFLFGWLFLAAVLALTSVYPAILFATANPELGPIVASVFGTFLLAGCYLSIGILFSAMTENQIVAGALTFGFSLFSWIVAWASQQAGPVWGEVLSYLSLINHFNNFGQGIIATPDVAYYLSIIGIGLFLTHRILDSYRWR